MKTSNLNFKIGQIALTLFTAVFFTACNVNQWNEISRTESQQIETSEIQEIFARHENGILKLDALSPAYDYRYDIGEKDMVYGSDKDCMRFTKVELQLVDKSPIGTILANFSFIDGKGNKVLVKNVDLLRLTPKMEGPDELIYSEMLLKEYDRFGYNFRREHHEFQVEGSKYASPKVKEALASIYRVGITNNCLSPGKWELSLTSEDFSNFNKRVKGENNLNQNRILAHSWFQLDLDLYQALLKQKNPGKTFNIFLPSDSMSYYGEQAYVDFEKLRNPIKYQLKTKTVEVGHKSKRLIEPVDTEQHFKKQFGLILKEKQHTYASILDEVVTLTQFRDQGFYSDATPNTYDYGWMRHLDSVVVEVIDAQKSESFVQISLVGKWSPYKLVLGNMDMSQLSEQKLTGRLFGINTYPKGRRYNPSQNTISFDPDLIPDEIKPYLLLTDSKTGNWVNNQYKGIEKVYISYESIERDILEIYVLSYERIIPVWMAKVKLPKQFREQVRIKKNLYNY